jgi:predicted MFS family arabinose efflux permease
MSAPLSSPTLTQPRFFRGWWMVVVAIVGQALGVGPILVYTFGVFAKPLAAGLNSNRTSIALAVSLLDLTLMFSSPGVGRLVDHFSARKVIVGSFLGLVATLVALSMVQPPLWHLLFLYVLAAILGVGTTSVTFARVIANWFDRRRGLALGLASTGVGLGVVITPPLAQYLIDRGGWRMAYLGLAAGSFLIGAPFVAIFLRATPQEVGLLPDGDDLRTTPPRMATLSGLTVSEAIRTRTFWLLCVIFCCVGASVNGAAAHLTPLLTDRGASSQSAAFALSVFGAAGIVGRVGNGYLVDHFFAPRIAAILFSGAAIGITVLWSGTAGIAAFVAAALLGLAIGAESDVMPFLISRYFGMRSMAELYGCAFGSFVLGNATGRYLYATGFDAFGSYSTPLAFGAVVLLLAILALFGLGKYRQFPPA